MIEFDKVSKSFWTKTQRKIILSEASFRVTLGKSMGILAPNGTGKTTLINMMANLEQPDEGTIRRTSRVSFPLGFMGGLKGSLTAAENCRFIADIYGIDPDYMEAYCRWICELGDYFEMPVNTYSSGMRARLNFALLMAIEFDIYLIDESAPVTTDARFNMIIGKILKERLSRTTLVLVSHDPGIVERYCDCAAVLQNGKIHMFDSLAEAKRLYDYTKSS
ncbi:ABC transporter ATP-binding protein [Palleronia caenipelagi]|uniref:ATP-binding cassette domain-containing protein n=1 Tax=Palleronia caenipelagi TaxID=2489174 RepID=A0A547QAV2_9RHOB|nr:ATP-binding cassette domain-containing protein [Palleronia caenipelagi]TRD23476.1 ATP-binding cassette domain-containing protein [Palleronia caenipelagi]